MVTNTLLSFRRKPESRAAKDWTPACAGVTGEGITTLSLGRGWRAAPGEGASHA